eukprot:scaffold8554_cov85-Cylindrotheca_fusiformis.AAC.2
MNQYDSRTNYRTSPLPTVMKNDTDYHPLVPSTSGVKNTIDTTSNSTNQTNSSSGSGSNSNNNSKRMDEPFPLKLHRMLSDVENTPDQEVLSWGPNGRYFVILQPKVFANRIMGKYFRQTKYKSFQRQLNLYGFVREVRGKIRGVYSHSHFIKDNRELCVEIKRINKTRNGADGSSIHSGSSSNNNNNSRPIAPPMMIHQHHQHSGLPMQHQQQQQQQQTRTNTHPPRIASIDFQPLFSTNQNDNNMMSMMAGSTPNSIFSFPSSNGPTTTRTPGGGDPNASTSTSRSGNFSGATPLPPPPSTPSASTRIAAPAPQSQPQQQHHQPHYRMDTLTSMDLANINDDTYNNNDGGGAADNDNNEGPLLWNASKLMETNAFLESTSASTIAEDYDGSSMGTIDELPNNNDEDDDDTKTTDQQQQQQEEGTTTTKANNGNVNTSKRTISNSSSDDNTIAPLRFDGDSSESNNNNINDDDDDDSNFRLSSSSMNDDGNNFEYYPV